MPDTNTENLFIYHLTLTDTYNDPTNWNEQVMVIIQQHAAFLNDLGEQGILGFAGRTMFNPGDEHLFGIAVIKAESIDEAKRIMKNDPAVKHNIQRAQIFPFSMGIRFLDNFDK